MSDKLLAEFCGVCWHEWEDYSNFCTHCEVSKDYYPRGMKEHRPNPDFTSPDGMALLYKAMGEKGEWASFYKFNHNKNYVNGHSKDWHSVKFHELTDLTKKRDLLAQFIKEDV